MLDSGASEGGAWALAEAIEEAINAVAAFPSDEYKDKAMGIVAALQRRDGSALRASVLGGRVAPSTLATMSADELAPEHVRARRNAMRRAESTAVNIHAAWTTDPDLECPSCGRKTVESRLASEQRDVRKSEIWGGGASSGESRVILRCSFCGHKWSDD